MNRNLFIGVVIIPLAFLAVSRLAEATHYGATYAPTPVPPLTAGQTVSIAVTVKNTGSGTNALTWTSSGTNPFRLSYHWYQAGTQPTTAGPNFGAVVWNGEQTTLSGQVRPGQSVTLQATLKAPPTPGSYTLKWDMVHQNVTWFSQKNVPMKDQAVTVNPPATGPRAAPRATQSIMSVRELCKITDCTPKITSVFLFSYIRPGGGVVVFGERFGGPRFPGQLRLKGLRRWDGAPVGDLPLEDLSWDDTVVGGYIPWVTGVRDQDATLQVVTKAGVSNDQKVRFTAARAADQVKYGGVLSAVCSDAGGENLCGFGSILSIIGHHRGTYTSGAEGTDVYEGLLKNGWVFKTYDWLDRAGVDRGFEGFRPDSPNLYATVKWFYDAGLFSGMHYKLNIYIEGPADVPYR